MERQVAPSYPLHLFDGIFSDTCKVTATPLLVTVQTSFVCSVPDGKHLLDQVDTKLLKASFLNTISVSGTVVRLEITVEDS